MAKVLLVDTNFSSAPIHRALVADGHEVHVVGGNPFDCLAKQAGHYWRLDYSDTKALSELVDGEGFEYLVPGCTDRSYESCVAVGQGRFAGLDTPQAMSAVNHKGEFRRVCAAIGLPVPRLFPDATAAAGRDVIVKPVDSFSGKGITILPDAHPGEIDRAVAFARESSPTKAALIEEFVDGQLHSHSAFLSRNKVVCDFLVQEDGTANRFVVDTSRVLDDSARSELMGKLRASIEAFARHLGLQDGLLHTQFIAKDSQVWLIEMTRRCPGDLYSQLIELSTGFPYAHCYAMPFVDRVQWPSRTGALHPIMRHTISVPSEQHLGDVRFRRGLHIERYVPLALAGDPLPPSPRGRVAVMFCRERDQESLEELYSATLRRELYVVSD